MLTKTKKTKNVFKIIHSAESEIHALVFELMHIPLTPCK